MASNVVAYVDKRIGSVEMNELDNCFNKSVIRNRSRANSIVDDAISSNGVEFYKKSLALSVASPSDMKSFDATFIKDLKQMKEILDHFKTLDMGYLNICIGNHDKEAVITAAGNGHKDAIAFRKKFCGNTVMEKGGEVRVLANKIGLIKKLWACVNENSGGTRSGNVSDGSKSTLSQALKEHKIMTGGFRTLPSICYSKDKNGVPYMSKFLVSFDAGDVDYFTEDEVKQMIRVLTKDNAFQMIEDGKASVVLSAEKRERSSVSQIIKKNSMTMDYGFLFWAMLYNAGLNVNQCLEILMSCNTLNLTCSSDKKVKKFIDGKTEGFGERKGTIPVNDSFLKLRNYISSRVMEKKLLDNPFCLTEKVCYEVLKVAGCFPIVYNRTKFIGHHNLFCIKNICQKDFPEDEVETFLTELEKQGDAKGHIIHRGMVGNLFCNISLMDSNLITMKAI